MAQLRISPRATEDLIEIKSYIADDSAANADAFIDKIYEKMEMVVRQPGSGREETLLPLKIDLGPSILSGIQCENSNPFFPAFASAASAPAAPPIAVVKAIPVTVPNLCQPLQLFTTLLAPVASLTRWSGQNSEQNRHRTKNPRDS